VPLIAVRARWGESWREARRRGVAGLLIFAVVSVALRQFEIPGVEPVGYWPRWAFVSGLMAFAFLLVRCIPVIDSRARRVGLCLGCALAWYGLVILGIDVTWYHRPLERLKAVVPGRIYMSAMPTARGLEVAQSRHHFKTIINLFPEDTPLRSPKLPDELRFVKEHGIRYVGSPSENTETASNGFLDKTLALAQDPDAWPILVHCHGCMDRTPAWVGIYRFLVQKRPLDEILTEIERHRGYRPKASVILLYNRVLYPRDPVRYANDPTAAKLLRVAPASSQPSAQPPAVGKAHPNREPVPRVSRGGGPRAQRPNLTRPGRSLEYLRTLRDRTSLELTNRS
ncbi:protein-tyrosine phosphatase family protein, partial [Singulisphaera rosea]